jgi:transcriptional regulator NrdR family protein
LNIFEYLKPILISLYDKIKITIEECNSTSSFDDKIKTYVSHNIIDGEYFYSVRLFDITEIPVKNITYNSISKKLYSMNEIIVWRYMSLYRDFSYFKELKYFLLSLSSIRIKTQSIDSFSFFI